MSKRRTRAQKEADERAALRQRVGDMWAAATFCDPDKDEMPLCVSDYPRVRFAVLNRLLTGQIDDPESSYLISPGNADDYESVASLTDFLYRHGVRA